MSQQQISLALKPPRRPGFDNFIAGPNRAVVETLAGGLEAGQWYFVGGPAGSGRTHLLAATFANLHRAGLAVSFLSLSVQSHHALLAQSSGDWVVIDDIDLLATDHDGEMLLFNALNRWRAEHTGVVMSGCGRDNFVLPDLRSRLGQAIRLTIRGLEEAELTVLVQRVAAEHEVVLGRGATDYLISRAPRNPAAMVRLMELCAVRALSDRRTISIPLIREVLQSCSESS